MERWEQIESVFYETLNLPESQREAYLQHACANDAEMFREVSSLIRSSGDVAAFGPWAAAAAAKLILPAPVLTPGERLGPYEILSFIAAGGMGAVYRAHDPRTGREVAIKVCADRFSERFEREIRTIAALNHPNICTLYDVGPNYLVMELVEGDFPKGPLPLETAINYALQIADALEAAHEKGITHRDLKPANIKIKADGTLKVLDFGLAKVLPAVSSDDPRNSPTFSIAATEAGLIVGTAGYMSPEQARGKPVDKRTDIWAFGVVLHEMLTGEKLFEGETVSDTLARVLTEDPDLSRIPAKARRLLSRCLQKDVKRRLRDIGEARFLLEEEDQSGIVAAPQGRRRILPWMSALSMLAATIVLAFVASRHLTEDINVAGALKLSVALPENTTFDVGSIPAVSPNGRLLAFSGIVNGQQGLWLRDLNALETRLLPRTDGATYTFWSPDSRWIGFFTRDGKLKKISVKGGSLITICDAEAAQGGTWNQNDQIVYSNGGALFRVSAIEKSSPVQLSEPDRSAKEVSYLMPWFLPDGRHFLYTARNRDLEEIRIYIADLNSTNHMKDRHMIIAAMSNAIYAPPGYLLFVRDGTLMAQPFDADKIQTTGEAVPIAENVYFYRNSFESAFSASKTGLLVYGFGGRGAQITWFNRDGQLLGTIGPPGDVARVAISPDGSTVAYDRRDGQTGYTDIWLHDLVVGTDSRFTLGPFFASNPVWSPDGRYIAFTPGGAGISRRATTGSAQDERLDDTIGPGSQRPHEHTHPSDWSRDYLIEVRNTNSIWLLPTVGEKKPFVYLDTQFNESDAVLSPNGQWLAYSSDASKRREIYVETFPTRGPKWQVSANGGSLPRWSRDGKELYFIAPDSKLMAVEIDGGPKLIRGRPKALFETRLATNGRYDVSKDGRFLIPTQIESTGSVPLTVIVNWTASLKR